MCHRNTCCAHACTDACLRVTNAEFQSSKPYSSSTEVFPTPKNTTQHTQTHTHKYAQQRLYSAVLNQQELYLQTIPLRLKCSIYCFISLDRGAHTHQHRHRHTQTHTRCGFRHSSEVHHHNHLP